MSPPSPNSSKMRKEIALDAATHGRESAGLTECIAWVGPIGNPSKDGVPTQWSPGFVFDETRGLEAFIMPLVLAKKEGLFLSSAFWGSRKGVKREEHLPPPSNFTEDDREALEGAGIDPETYSKDYESTALTSLMESRKDKLKLINRSVVRVRIIGLDPDTVAHPKPEEWAVLALGKMPEDCRFGLLVPLHDPEGRRWLTGPGTLDPVKENQVTTETTAGRFIRQSGKNGVYFKSPEPTAQVGEVVAQAAAAAKHQTVIAGDPQVTGGLPAAGQTIHKGQLKTEKAKVVAKPDMGECGDGP